MKNNYMEILRHIPIMEDHGHLYMYYGTPYCDECDVYEDQDAMGNKLIVSYECHELCTAIADHFEKEMKWNDSLYENNIRLEDVFDVDVEKQNFTIIVSLLLYMVASMTYEDKFIDALNNGYMIRLLKRLEKLV
ncbi:MAG: hypothetical protein JXQ23_09310 [Clostridia bacterium]|nr:hypothetical protein [Clostridia bacterium]